MADLDFSFHQLLANHLESRETLSHFRYTAHTPLTAYKNGAVASSPAQTGHCNTLRTAERAEQQDRIIALSPIAAEAGYVYPGWGTSFFRRSAEGGALPSFIYTRVPPLRYAPSFCLCGARNDRLRRLLSTAKARDQLSVKIPPPPFPPSVPLPPPPPT